MILYIPMSDRGQEFLIANGTLSRRSPQQQQIIGCLACRWKTSEAQGSKQEAYHGQIVKCSGFRQGTVSNILQRLTRGGVIIKTQEDIDAKVERRWRRVYYKPADSDLGAAFLDKLDVPEICGLEDSDAKKEAAQAARAAKREARVNHLINTSSREQLEAIIARATERIEQLNEQ